MQWPAEIVEDFRTALDPIEPTRGHTEDTVIRFLLDEYAAGVVFRAQNDPAQIPDHVDSIPTVMGTICDNILFTANVVSGLTQNRPEWSHAMHNLYAFVRANAHTICTEYSAHPTQWPEVIHAICLETEEGGGGEEENTAG